MQPAIAQDDIIGDILELVRRRTGVDFRLYRPGTIRRRLANRMLAAGTSHLPEYLARLESSQAEAGLLLGRLAVRVSRFYRNASAFDELRARALALPSSDTAGPLRVWCAGCGEGEEAFTLAMLLAERGIAGEVLATDIDEAALARARVGGPYGTASLRELPGALAARFIERGQAGAASVHVSLRERVRFACHDLVGARPPAGGFDLVACRNVVIYLQRPAREQAFANLVGALRPGGVLFLGEAEWPPATVLPRLGTLCARHRIFRLEGGAA